MKWIFLLFCLLFLCGCGEKPAQEAMAQDAVAVINLDRAYTITIGVPRDATEVLNLNGSKLYRHEGGEYEILTKVFFAEDADRAIEQLMGTKKNDLCVMETTRFSMPEYRFTWYDASEQALLRADLVMDKNTCYAVVFSVDEQLGRKYDALVTETFSTFGLHFDEGV